MRTIKYLINYNKYNLNIKQKKLIILNPLKET